MDMADVEGLRRHADLYRRGGGLVPPAEVVLSWPAPNYVNPETHNESALNVVIVFFALSIAVFVARIWARVKLAKNAGLDDLIMTFAMIPLLAMTVATVLACRTYGFQWHAWDQTSKTLITTRQFVLAIEIPYLAATSLIKISILCFYKRITNGSITRKWVYWIWASIIFVVLYFFAFTFTIIFSCSPIEGYWHYFDIAWRLQNELHCHNEGAEIVSVVIISTLQDFFLCALPIVLIWNLQIHKRQKIALCGIFGMGLFTCVCGVMRTYYAIYVYYYTYDITWWAWYGWIWTALEAQLGVICACAPALKGFFKRYFNLSSVRSAGSSNLAHGSSGKRSLGYGKISPGNSLATSNKVDSLATSNMDGSWWEPEPVPLNRIKVSTGANVIVEDREEVVSRSSTSSTRNLTALPVNALPEGIQTDPQASKWHGNRTVITAFSRSSERDLERAE